MSEISQERPYKPSWVDLFNAWVKRLPLREWIFYIGFGLGLILIQILVLWVEGDLTEAEALLPVILYNALIIPFLLGLMDLLDDQAVNALDSMRPVMDMAEPEINAYQYRLSNMPAGAPLVAGLILLALIILMEWLWIAPARFSALDQLPVFSIVFHIMDKSPAFVFGAFMVHTIRQLSMINRINSNHTRINLFNLVPLRAFSKVTASTAVGLVVGILGWMLINPDLMADPVSLGMAGAFAILAIGIFVWPLWGVHRLIEIEKARALREINQRFEVVFAKFNQYIHDDDYAATERLNGTIASLEVQYERIGAIPTWPWSPETARIALTAIALPLMLMIIQIFVLQALNR